ncbi:MAG TPA: hypothetical protein VEL76_42830 [Gemmataceae bacterium]|nr:hypothetical protein [Gemmataceae bacterium]
MDKKNTTSSAQTAALVDALETLLDLFRDGRVEELDEKELAAYQKAEDALRGYYDTHKTVAGHSCHGSHKTGNLFFCQKCNQIHDLPRNPEN